MACLNELRLAWFEQFYAKKQTVNPEDYACQIFERKRYYATQVMNRFPDVNGLPVLLRKYTGSIQPPRISPGILKYHKSQRDLH